MKKLTHKQIKALRDEFLSRITNKIAFSLDMVKFANEVEVLRLKYGEFAVYIAIKEAYKAYDLEKMDDQVDEELSKLTNRI